jgi:23S rRNA (uracil1939-C5)-methyltransferase
MSRRRTRLPPDPVELHVDSLSHDGRGVATGSDGKRVFIAGALPGEKILSRYRKRRRRFDEADLLAVLTPSPDRVEPRCTHFGVCGGCSLQHMDTQAQIRFKQEALLEALARIGKVAPKQLLEPLAGDHWGYRNKARLGAKYVEKKGKLLVGFRERGSSFVTDLHRCEILAPIVGEHIEDLNALISGLSIDRQVPQIEVALGDEGGALVIRVLAPPSGRDLERLRAFEYRHGLSIYLQDGGPESVRALSPNPPPLHYRLPRYQLQLEFLPTDFTQVNPEMNRDMVSATLNLLQPEPKDAVLDLFCGLGNFTLPLARMAAKVTGVEGDAGLVARARANAERNGVANVEFFTANLSDPLDAEPWLHGVFDKVLLDPPRSGAAELLEHLPRLGAQRIVYVSCYPSTLARDADVLVNQLGYQLRSAGVMDMFPHTAHVESIALFERRS